MANGFNILDILAEVFGTSGIHYVPEGFLEDDQFTLTGTSWMGTPVVFPAQLQAGDYFVYTPSGELEKRTFSDFMLPEATMFTFRRAKNITRTNVLGSNGTVKEIYGLDDWIVDVQGVCLNTPERSAQEQLETLLEWEEVADSIEITGDLFSKLNIMRVAMNDFAFNVLQGKPGAIAVRMQLYSDEPLELKISNMV